MSEQRRLRADAQQNRARLIHEARRAFAGEEEVSLDAIARAAGVGIGTLYRHFPNREALVEAVYRDQVADLRTGAAELLASRAPVPALRAWMELFADWADAKRGMVRTLAAMRAAGTVDQEENRRDIEEIIATMLDAGVRDGELRGDVKAADIRAQLAGTLAAATDREQAARLFDLLLDGLRSRR